ncbi:MAG: hypothetical protein HZA60_04595 [Deltaproteobacteria bacterium]|nr:hypothetical protein [Deltaproteobacteria bacterium]
MAHYLVSAAPKNDRMQKLEGLLRKHAFVDLQPFGRALTYSLLNARVRQDGMAVWEEEDYCTPPLAQERKAVLDEYFYDITVAAVPPGEGWRRIRALPPLFPGLTTRKPHAA